MSTSTGPPGKKRKVEYSESSDSSREDKIYSDPENVEKSLTNLQINMSALAGKIEEMMAAFQSFSEGFKANHAMLVEDMEELKKLGRQLKDNFR